MRRGYRETEMMMGVVGLCRWSEFGERNGG
jgi:hypothetical protein